MKKTWILIANCEKARCFERRNPGRSLTELAGFMHPHTTLAEPTSGADLTGATGKVHGRSARAGRQFEPHADWHAKERSDFAQLLADYLNHGVTDQRFDQLVLIAPGPLLGALRPCLSPGADAILCLSIVSDLTQYQGAELKQRIDQAMRLTH